jgi:hypothetical protein
MVHYLEAMEVGPGIAVSCHYRREVRSYVYFYFKPVLCIWKEIASLELVGLSLDLWQWKGGLEAKTDSHLQTEFDVAF